MTETPGEVYAFIKKYIAEHGYAPSNREIMAGCHISSTSVVDYNLTKLEEMGRIKRRRGVARSIVVLK
jgi:repressor LexA